MTEKLDNDKKEFTFDRKKIFVSAPIAIILISLCIYFINSRYVSTDDACIKLGISSLSPQISGIISEIKVENTHIVKKGDALFVIDATPFNINIQSAKADLANAVNQIQGLRASYYAKLSDLQSAQIDLAYYQKQYDRTKTLNATNAASQMELDNVKRQLDKATQSTTSIDETIKQQLANLDGDAELDIEKRALYTEAKAKLDQAQFDLDNTTIYAPFDGVVANLYIKEGDFATKGTPLLSIVDTDDVWLEANFKETDITNIKPGQRATVTIDSFPGKKLKATVVGITPATGSEFSILPAQNSSGNWVKVTQRVAVRLKFDKKPNLPLSSGISAVVTVDTKS